MSVSFDRAAGYYDETRALPADAMTRLLELLGERLSLRGRTLEIGAGTGRFTVPLRAAGVEVFGVDISAAMLSKLREKDPAAPTLRADATRLPFRDGAFGAALAVHVLHLIPAWRQAVAELVRVLGRRGLVLIDTGGPDNPIELRFFQEAGVKAEHPGLRRPEDLDAEMSLLGVAREALPEIQVVHEVRIGEYIGRLEAGLFSRCWAISPGALRSAGAATRAWANEAVGDLDTVRRVERPLSVRAYRLP